MRALDLTDDPHIPVLTDMLRGLTGAGTSREVMGSFMSRFDRIRPVDYFVGVAIVPGKGYRVVYRYATGVNSEASVLDARGTDLMARLPIHTGGLIGRLIADHCPKFLYEFDAAKDPVLHDLPEGLTSCMALPLFSGTRVEEWTFAFSRRADGFDSLDVSRALLTANLLAAASRHLDSANTVQRLHLKVRDQLDQAARVQQSLLPSKLPDIPGLELATSYLPSDMAGGDYYDFFRLPGERWGVLIADVSGHGAAAAIVMAMLHAILHAYAPLTDPAAAVDPAAVMEFANTRLLAAGLDGSFVTAFFCIFDPVEGTLTYSNAGHPPPRLKNGVSGRVAVLDQAASLPLGIDAPLGATHATIALQPADTVVLYTDGITEAFSPAGEMFGEEGLDAALTKCTGQPDCIVETVHQALFAHRQSATRDDDQTLVALRFHGLCRV